MLLAEVRARALRSLIPPPRLRLAQWLETNLVFKAQPLWSEANQAKRDLKVVLL